MYSILESSAAGNSRVLLTIVNLVERIGYFMCSYGHAPAKK